MSFYVWRKSYEAYQWNGKNVGTFRDFFFSEYIEYSVEDKKLKYKCNNKSVTVFPGDYVLQDGSKFFRFPEKQFLAMFKPEKE